MSLLVTIGSDSATHWVKTPDGHRFNLGPVSVLSFVTKLALGTAKQARDALDRFLQGKEVVLRVDDDKMWDLLAPRRAFWSADSFIPYAMQLRGNSMTTIDKDIELLGRHVQALCKAAADGISPEKMAEGAELLERLAYNIQADQSDNSEYYGLGDAETHEVVMDKSAGDKLAYDTYRANSEAATQILDMMESANGRIDELVTAGKKFDHKRAKQDLHAVTSKVAGIVNDVDLTAPWVAGDLAKLSNRAEHLHGLFFPSK